MRINPSSVRFRTAASAAATLIALLVAAGLAIFLFVRAEIEGAFDETLLEQARDRAALVAAGAPADSLTTAVGYEEIVVIVSRGGAVLAAGGAADPTEVADLAPGLFDREVTVAEGGSNGQAVSIEGEPLRLAVVETDAGIRVIVGSEGESTGRTVSTVATVLVAATSAIAVIVAIAIWLVIGRALAPVQRMRDDLDSIIHASSGDRVTEPGSGDEIDQLAGTMNDVLDRLDRQSSVRRRFVSDASHELKSPLANARIRIETAGSGLAEAEEQELRAAVTTELDRMQALVDDLLYLAQNDETTTVAPERVALDDVVFDEAERAAVRSSTAIDASGVQPAMIVADRRDVARAVRNLVENAVRHADARVAMSIMLEEQQAVVVVDDDGPGIAEGDRATVFERFARLGEDRARAEGGTGLGLSIVAGIADKNGGRVSVGESPAGGARFELRLPLVSNESA